MKQPDQKRNLKSLFLLASSVVLGQNAQAQEISTSLPLTSVGDELMWSVGDQNLNLDVPISGKVRLELFSPRVDPSDYRSDTYYGDEQYDQKETTTTFSLINSEGKEVLSRVYEPGQAAWETLFDQELPAGQYRLQVSTKGNAKNTFAVRLAGVSAAVSANRLSVTIHSQDWKPVLNVTTDGQPYVLKMYDGDGPEELQARLLDSQGNIYPMPVSGDLDWTDLPLPAPAGEYTLELRQVPTAKQFSNTVSFALNRLGAEAPITLSRVDQTGRLSVTAELLLPTGPVPTQADILIGNEPVTVDENLDRIAQQGDYTIMPAQVKGAEVTIDHGKVTVPKGGVAEAKIQIRPQVQLHLQADKKEVCIGDIVTFTAKANTAYANDLPMRLDLEAFGLELEGDATVEGEFSAGKDGLVKVTARATQPGKFKIAADLQPWDQQQVIDLHVHANTTALEFSQAELEPTQAGGEVQVRFTLKNTSDQEVEYNLVDQLPAQLKALDSTEFKGKLAAGETREFSYRAQVLEDVSSDLKWNATLDTPTCSVPQHLTSHLAVTPKPQPKPAPAPAPAAQPVQVRSSVITLPFDVPREAKTMTISHRIPADAQFVAGSTKLDGKSVADPSIGENGNYYWTVGVPTGNQTEKGAAVRGVLTYELTHKAALGALAEPSLSVNLPGERVELLQGKMDHKDVSSAKDFNDLSTMPKLSENEGSVKLPLNGSMIRLRDRITVVVETALNSQDVPTINGVAISDELVGETTQDPVRQVKRITYVGVPITEGDNIIRSGADEIKIVKVGATNAIEITPEQLVADGSTPIRIKVRALDQNGHPTAQSVVTIASNLEPRTADANPGEAGYQVKLVDGQGYLVLQPQSAPTALELKVANGNTIEKHVYQVRPNKDNVGVGQFSVSTGIGADILKNTQWQARGYYEGPIGDGKLYIAADSDQLPGNQNHFTRYSVYGDASSETIPLQGIDPVAFAYDHPTFRADYRRTALPIDVLPLGETVTALTAQTKTAVRLSGFAALLPKDTVKEELAHQGSRIIKLKQAVIEGSESLVVTTYERGTGKVIGQKSLAANVDYTIDAATGLLILSQPITMMDEQFNEQRLTATYRVEDSQKNRKLAYGAQVSHQGEKFSVGAAAVSMDETVTIGARARYEDGALRADGLVAYSGGIQVSAGVEHNTTTHKAGVRARYQQPSYNKKGLGRTGDGLAVDGNAQFKVTEKVGVVVDGEYHDVPDSGVAKDALGSLTKPDTKKGGSVSGRVTYDLKPFTVGLGAKYAFGDASGTSAIGSIGYQGKKLSVNALHSQPLGGRDIKTTTDITVKYALTKQMSLGFTDKITWGMGHAAALALDSQLGNVNYAVGYELPTAGGAGNRARFSVGTVVPITKNISAGIRGLALYHVATSKAEVGTSLDVNYKTEQLNATIGTDVNYAKSGFGVSVRSGITGSVNDHLTLSADGLYENRPSTEPGQRTTGERLNLGYAYRNNTVNSLGYVRYLNGSVAANKSELLAGATAEYRRATWAVRSGFDTRQDLKDRDSFTWQAYGGATAYVNEWLGLGGWVRALGQPAKPDSQVIGYGLESNVRVMPGTWVTAGYNFKGFENIDSAFTYTKPGAYLRLDVTLDEAVGKGRK